MADQREFQVKGNKFTSTFTDQEVFEGLRDGIKDGKINGNFAKDLVAGRIKYGQFTERQQPWAHKLYIDFLDRQKPRAAGEPGFQTIVAHMQKCRDRRDNGGAGLLNPCIRIGNGEPEILGGVKIAMKLTGPRSKRPGHVSVAQSHRFGDGDFYGYINPDGEFDGYSKCTEEVRAILRRIAVEPGRVISELGRETGLCCYCPASLTQAQSKIAGCGKTCSRNYDVWYPTAAETREYLVGHPAVLVGCSDADRWS